MDIYIIAHVERGNPQRVKAESHREALCKVNPTFHYSRNHSDTWVSEFSTPRDGSKRMTETHDTFAARVDRCNLTSQSSKFPPRAPDASVCLATMLHSFDSYYVYRALL